MRIVCQQTILIKYHALFVIFEKSGKICNRLLLQIIGGASSVNNNYHTTYKLGLGGGARKPDCCMETTISQEQTSLLLHAV